MIKVSEDMVWLGARVIQFEVELSEYFYFLIIFFIIILH